MRKTASAAFVLLLAACTASGANSSADRPRPEPEVATTTPGPSASHTQLLEQPTKIVLIVMENHSYDDIVGSSEAPFTNGAILPKSVSLTDMHQTSYPSLPNYVWMTAGTDCGASGSNSAWDRTCPSLYDQLLARNIDWTVYAEDYPGSRSECDTSVSSDTASNNYARKHVAPLLFASTSSGSACTDHVRGFPGDVVNDGRPPSSDFEGVRLDPFTVVIPNMCHDMHNSSDACGSAGGGIAAGDRWLSLNWKALRTAAGPQGVVILTWDEGEGDTRIPTFISGLNLPRLGSRDGSSYDHGSTLRAIQDAFGLRCLAAACKAEPFPILVSA